MALRPHWLDDVFKEAGSMRDSFCNNTRVKAAFAMAEAEYETVKKFIEENPGICGASPEQAALSTFLEVVDLQRDYDVK